MTDLGSHVMHGGDEYIICGRSDKGWARQYEYAVKLDLIRVTDGYRLFGIPAYDCAPVETRVVAAGQFPRLVWSDGARV